ncbi:MAG: sugar phosphate isomerase/epimerase [Ruminococcaceae bacterium]|nr:sugar phosphate isomerase/epimerase [Oscillospiraceae bacterium]
MYRQLLPFAKEHGVKIATENMWGWDSAKDHASPVACSTHDSFLEQVLDVGDDFLVACVDVGHAEMKGLGTSAAQMIRTLGHHVQALHLHDIDLHKDNHQIPFSLNIDYGPIVKALKDIDYRGVFTLEADGYLGSVADMDIFEGVCNLQKAARRLANIFEIL